MSVSSSKASLGVSKQELYYISRNLFRRNRSFLEDPKNSDYIFISPKKHKKLINLNNRPSSTNSFSPQKSQNLNEQKNQSNFERFFNTSANKTNLQCEDEFVKSKERFFYSRERFLNNSKEISTRPNSSFNISQRFQNTPIKGLQNSSGFQENFTPNASEFNKSYSKLSQEKIEIPFNQQIYLNPFLQNQNKDVGQAYIDDQIHDFQQFTRMQQMKAQLEQYNVDNQWKNIRYRAPRYTFYKNSPRKSMLSGPSAQLLDDQRRYNNFQLQKPDIDHTLNMNNTVGRNYKVFKQYQMNDLVYPKCNQQYEKIIFDNQALKCQFDISKQDQNGSPIGRSFYEKQHKNSIPSTPLDYDKITAAQNDLLPFRKNRIPKFDKISARERQSSSPYRLLKSNENPYIHEQKPGNKMKVKKYKYEEESNKIV